MTPASPTEKPPERPSREADKQQLDLARREGEAYAAELQYMVKEVADTGDQKRAGDYVVAFAQEKAEGMYHPDGNGGLEWMEPGEGENCHLEVSVSDAGDGRFIPYLSIQASLTSSDGTRIGPFEVPFLWHPGLYHYGKNIALPGDGSYSINIRVAPPTFARHDRTNGRRYAQPVSVDFENVKIRTGRG